MAPTAKIAAAHDLPRPLARGPSRCRIWRVGGPTAGGLGGSKVPKPMFACLVVLLAVLSPRLALVVVWIFSDWLGDAFTSWVVPLLGFFLLPWTTLAYAGMWVAGSNEVYGFEWFIVGLAFVVDLGSWVGGGKGRRRGD